MGFCCGIVGLPNVGKSTIFNAITNTTRAQAANYPFCTIEPNVGTIAVPDERLEVLQKIAKSGRIVPTTLEIVDIAGLVKGASKGEGLGNQFLSHIKDVNAIIQVVRCFDNDDITHVENSVDPVRDTNIIEQEMILADMASLEKKQQNLQKKRDGSPEEAEAVRKALEIVSDGNLLILAQNKFLPEELEALAKMQLITNKKILYVANIDECGQNNQHIAALNAHAATRNLTVIPICAQMESEMMSFKSEEKLVFLQELGFKDTSLGQIVKAGYQLLDLITFFTVGEMEARAWTVRQKSTAPKAAGVIHTDFETGFIKAETISYKDFIDCDGESGARENGKMRLEGKDYLVQDGDIIHFKFNN